MKYIILFLFLFQFTLQAPYGWVECDDGETICFEGYQCCKKDAGGYNCCRESQTCSPDGERCLNYNPLTTRFDETPAAKGHQQAVPHILVIVDNFLKTIEFYSHFPKTMKCFKNLEHIYPDIIALIKKIKEIKSIEELIPIIRELYIMYPYIKDAVSDCIHEVPQELKDNYKRIYDIITQPGYLQKLLAHAQQNAIVIMMKVVAAGTSFQQKKYPECGTNLGEVFNLIFKF